MSSVIPVQELRVGMFVHLDLGWMQHPFALSSFRIQTDEQIEVIRGLGLSTLRWDPAQSAADTDSVPLQTDGPAETAAEAAARAQRAALSAHRRHMAELDRECHEAGRALRDATRQALDMPRQAREQAEAVSRKLGDRLSAEGEFCVRLVNSQAGDRASAHGLNVAVIAMLLGRALKMGEDELADLGLGAMLHDIGKLELPDRLRHHDESFNGAESNAYREHVAKGVALGRRMELSTGALAVLGQHHELADGSGFPLHLTAERTTLAARIVGIVDRYDNLCNPAVLARAMTPHEAVSMLFTQHRQRYDEMLLTAFIRMMGVYPAGSIVQLTDDRHALVMAVNSSRPLKPSVLVHDPAVPPDEALLLDLEQMPDLAIRRSLPPSRLPPEVRSYLAPRQQLSYFFDPVVRRPGSP